MQKPTAPGTSQHSTHHNYCNDQITKVVVGRACSIHWTKETTFILPGGLVGGRTLKTFIRVVSGSISAETLTCGFRDIPQSPQENSGVVPRLGNY
jgi:hypothetical protein